MPEANIEIKNLPQIKRAFQKVPGAMATELNKAIHKSIFLIERESKINSPVDTGRLRASHQSKFSPLKGIVGPTANYSIFVHQGTRYQKARPFLFQAVKTRTPSVRAFFTEAVQKALDSIGRGL